MTTIDLTEAVEAAARDRAGTSRGEGAYDHLPRIVKHHLREIVLPVVTSAAPAIEAAVRAQVAAEIETRVPDGHPRPAYLDGLRYAASIARGES